MTTQEEQVAATPDPVMAEMQRIRKAFSPALSMYDGDGDTEDPITYAKEIVAMRAALSVLPSATADAQNTGEPVGYVTAETLEKLKEGDGGFIVGSPAYTTEIPLYAAPPAPDAALEAADTVRTLSHEYAVQSPEWRALRRAEHRIRAREAGGPAHD